MKKISKYYNYNIIIQLHAIHFNQNKISGESLTLVSLDVGKNL